MLMPCVKMHLQLFDRKNATTKHKHLFPATRPAVRSRPGNKAFPCVDAVDIERIGVEVEIPHGSPTSC